MRTTIIWIIIILIVAVGGYFLLSNDSEETGENMEENGDTSSRVPAPGFEDVDEMIVNEDSNDFDESDVEGFEAPDFVLVDYTDNGFSPQEITIKKGDTVRFLNSSSKNMWVGSAQHPTHTVYSGTTLANHCPDNENDDFDQCEATGNGTFWEFTFNQTGQHGYHNHVGANHWGRVIVE